MAHQGQCDEMDATIVSGMFIGELRQTLTLLRWFNTNILAVSLLLLLGHPLSFRGQHL